MIDKCYNIILTVVTIVIFQHQTFAPWDEKPEKPSEELTKDCEGWISHYGFTPDGKPNRELAKIRNRIYDPDVSLWAAGYASYLVSFYSDEYTNPWDFCVRNRPASLIVNNHLSLNEAKEDCIFWIRLYGYDINDYFMRWHRAKERDAQEDEYISIWAFFYGRFITKNVDNAELDSEQFCNGIGKMTDTSAEKLPFMSLHETRLSCQEWIALAGFTDNSAKNYKLVKFLNPKYHEIILHFWALFYFQFLSVDKNNGSILPGQFCHEIGEIYNTDARMKSFVSLNETKLSCQEWIELAGFTDDIEKNYELITSLNPKYHEIIFHHWTKQYINEFRGGDESDTNKFKLKLNLFGSDTSKIEFKPKPITPESFCIQIDCPIFYKREFFK